MSSSRTATPPPASVGVRQSPRTRIPHASPTFSTINVDHMFASPPLVPLQQAPPAAATSHSHSHSHAPTAVATPQQSSVGAGGAHGRSAGGGEFAHPASVVQSPMHAPVNAMGFMRSLNRGGSTAAAAGSSASAAGGGGGSSLSAAATPATRSRRGSLVSSMLLAEPAESKAPAAAGGTPATASIGMSAGSLLRSSSTSPTVRHRMRSPHPGGSGGVGFASPSLDPFDTPSLSGLGSLSASKSRYTHGLSKPFDAVAQSPFMMPTRRSPRVGAHSPASSFQSHFMSPSPGMPPLSHAHSPNISFALPSPSLVAAAGGLGMPAASSSTRDLNGGLHGGSSHHLNSHIFGSWDGDALTRRSPRLQAASQQSHSARRSPTSFNMFSPPTHAQYSAHAHNAMGDVHMHGVAAPSGSAAQHSSRPPSTSMHTRGHSGSGGHRRPSMSPPLHSLHSLNSVPSSPNLSILGKLRSLHASGPGGDDNGDGSARPHSPHLKLEGGEYAAQQQRRIDQQHAHEHDQEHQQQQQQRSGSKRGRSEYESLESPSPSLQGQHSSSQLQSQSSDGYPSHHKGASGGGGGGTNGYAGMPITSPAMVGALPPSSQPMSMADAARSPEPFAQPQRPTLPLQQALPPKSHELEQQQYTPSRRVPKSSLLKREKMDAEGTAVSRPRATRPPLSSESEGLSSPDMHAATSGSEPASLGNGSGSSCHQVNHNAHTRTLAHVRTHTEPRASPAAAATSRSTLTATASSLLLCIRPSSASLAASSSTSSTAAICTKRVATRRWHRQRRRRHRTRVARNTAARACRNSTTRGRRPRNMPASTARGRAPLAEASAAALRADASRQNNWSVSQQYLFAWCANRRSVDFARATMCSSFLFFSSPILFIQGEIDPASLSPASVLAYSFVYCPDVLLESMGNHQDYVESVGKAETHGAVQLSASPIRHWSYGGSSNAFALSFAFFCLCTLSLF